MQGKSRGRIAALVLRVRMSRVQVSVPETDCYYSDGGFSQPRPQIRPNHLQFITQHCPYEYMWRLLTDTHDHVLDVCVCVCRYQGSYAM